MCGILALVSLGAAVDCMLGSYTRDGVGVGDCSNDGEMNVPDEVRRLFQPLHRRGPDARGHLLLRSPATSEVQGAMWASVLHMRGLALCQQPIQDELGNALIWNGEVYGGNLSIADEQSDSQLVFQRLSAQLAHGTPEPHGATIEGEEKQGSCVHRDSFTVTRDAIARTLGGLQGEFAFVFWEAAGRRLWFGRDRLGRRSLLIKKQGGCADSDDAGQDGWGKWVALCSSLGHVPEPCSGVRQQDDAGRGGDGPNGEEGLVPDSASTAEGWEEVRPDGFYCLQLDARAVPGAEVAREAVEGSCGGKGSMALSDIRHCSWPNDVPTIHGNMLVDSDGRGQTGVEPRSLGVLGDECDRERAVEVLMQHLDESVRRRVHYAARRHDVAANGSRQVESCNRAYVAVMFSGGVDSTLLAALAHRHVDAASPIDLVNVCFDPCEAPDRYTGVEALEELRRVFPTRHWNFVTVDIDLDMVEAARSSILGAIYPCATQMDFNIGAALWFGAQGRGALYSFPPSASQDRVEATEPFDLTSYSAGSGVGTRGAEEEGDARLDDVLESARGDGSPVLKNPMRTDLEAAVEAIIADDPSLGVKLVVKALRLRQPQWLVGEGRVRPMVSKIKSQLRSSASPCAVVSQDACEESVGSFVAGTKSDPRQHVRGRSGVPIVDQLGAACRDRYTTPARVFLMGMGADEQLCGYSRYRSKFRVGGEEAVLADMAKDMARIWYRNLGRDDRCIADHGREARFPFLDECVVHRIKQMKLETIADLSLPPGIGDKLILRLVAGRVGISGAAKQVKRAIQFGTRIAKQSNKQTFGSNRKGSGEARILSDQVARSTC